MKSVTYAKCRRWVCLPVNGLCACFFCVLICVYVWFVWLYCILHIWKCAHSSVCVHMYMCVQIFRWRDRGVCKGVSVYDDGKAGLLSFNTVLVGHWAICKCTELTAEAQSSLVHPPTSSTTDPPPQHPSHCLPILSDWGLFLSREAEAHVFIADFVPMIWTGYDRGG